MNSQHASRLVNLPGELRNEIFRLALCAEQPVTNPVFEPSIRPKNRNIPPLGAALSRTCRSLNNELDTSTLYSENDFIFTRVSHIHAFFSHLSLKHARLVKGITIDLREASLATADQTSNTASETIGREWLHYLTCKHVAHQPGVWCSKLSTLRSDMPEVRELTIDLTNWQSPFSGTRRAGWKYLKNLLKSVEGLDGIKLKGRCLDAAAWNPRPMPWSLGPWFSPAYSKDETELLDLLGGAVREEESDGEEKLVQWSVVDGVTSLQVRVQQARGGSRFVPSDLSKVPSAGVITWESFAEHEAGMKSSGRWHKSRTYSMLDSRPPAWNE